MRSSRSRRKKASAVVADDMVFTLSDLEEDRTPMKVTVETLSADRRRILRQDTRINVSTESDTPHTDTDFCNEFTDLANIDLSAINAEIDKANGKSSGADSRKMRYVSSDQPFKNWIPHRTEFLNELLRSEGRVSSQCPACTDGRTADYRCDDCHDVADYRERCLECIVADHTRSPFHRIKKWNGSYFEKTTLKSMGLSIQLGHPYGELCFNPVPARSKMVVLHTNGIHPVSIKYCGCDRVGKAGNVRQQLLRYRLYPATKKDPMTCSTFTLLETTHLQNVQAKSGVYDLYTALERLTDNTGLGNTRDCYKAFSRSIREWKHLKMLKRAGRGHDVSGIAGTKPGDLAVVCPACPHAGINLPDGWENAPKSEEYLHRLTVSVDACFRVKRFAVSDENKDPIIDDGLAYFVEDAPYKAQIAKYKGQKAMAACTGLAALDHADSKFHNGYASTGVGACICGRHEFMLPNGVGDLQVGERFVNMDFIWCSALRHHPKTSKFTTYDIVCHWLQNLHERIAALLPEYRPTAVPTIDELMWAIGKLHWYSHKPVGHSRYSLNFIPGAARSDGEGIERRWWMIQPITSSTKMMGPGSRQGTLNDQFGYMNWRNLVKLGDSLSKKYLDVQDSAREQQADFNALSESLGRETVKEWSNAVQDWENDLKKIDPYITDEEGPSESSIRRKLAEEEEELVRTGKKLALHDVSPAAFLSMGLELEEQQRYLRGNARQDNSAKIFESRTALTRRVLRWREVQSVYMPIVPRILASGVDQYSSPTPSSSPITTQLVENTCLLLPSDLLKPCRLSSADDPAEIAKKNAAREVVVGGLTPQLIQQELQMRDAACSDALDDVRTKVHMRRALRQYKRVNVRHQGPNTRAQGLLASLERRIQQSADKYRASREALMSLTGGGQEWDALYNNKYLELQPEDIRALEDDDPATAHRRKRQKKGPAEGKRLMSWIWRGADTADGLTGGVRVEWLKSRARVLRWQEELRLLPEEVRRSVVFLQWKATQWETRATELCGLDLPLQAGLRAYAAKQAAISRGLSLKFSAKWTKTKAIIAKRDAKAATGEIDGRNNAGGSSTDYTAEIGPNAKDEANEEADDDDDGDGDGDDGDDDEDKDDDDDEEEAGVQELGEDEAVLAYMELDDVFSAL